MWFVILTVFLVGAALPSRTAGEYNELYNELYLSVNVFSITILIVDTLTN